MPKEKGTLLVFCPLLFHRVTPVESGVRYCIQEFLLEIPLYKVFIHKWL